MEKLILMGLFSLIYLRGVMIYLHSGLKGELIRALGIFIIMLAYSIDNIVWGAIGFITFNVGWLVLRLKENEYWKEIFGSLTYYERIIGINRFEVCHLMFISIRMQF